MIIRTVINAMGIQGRSTSDDLGILAPEASIRDAVRLLTARNFGIVLVCAADDTLVGVLSERDIIHSIDRHGEAGLELPVGGSMTRDPETCSLGDDAVDVIRRMNQGRFRHMPVLEEGRLAGMVSATDVLRYLARELTDKQREELWSLSLWL